MDHPRLMAEANGAAPAVEPRNNGSLRAQFRKTQAAHEPPFVLDAEFDAAPGFTILFGASGAGKTTLLDCVAGIAAPDTGKISLGGRVLFDSAQASNLPVAQRRCGYVFQNLALFPHMRVEQNASYGLTHLPKTERQQRTDAIL